MKLYHGTSASYLAEILDKGITPRGKAKGNWHHTVLSNPKAVYLTDAYAIYFATNAAENSATDEHKPPLVVFEIETDVLDLHRMAPDEDFLEQGTRKDPAFAHVPGTIPFNMKKRTMWFRRHALTDYGHAWPLSLEHMGTCCYYGTVPPEAIEAYVQWPYRHPATFASDPTITPLNYKIMGAYYRQLTRRLFGYEIEEDEAIFESHRKALSDPRLVEGVQRF